MMIGNRNDATVWKSKSIFYKKTGNKLKVKLINL